MAVWSIVNYLELSLDLRLDSEYYQPEYLFQEKKISNLEPRYLQNLAMISDGNHLTISEEFTDEGGVRYLRGQDLVNFFISDSNPVYIPHKAYETLNRSHMYEGDVLMSVIGTVGNVALVTNKYEPLTGSCKVAIIRPHSINPYFLAAYLASNIGKSQIYRRVRGAVQQGLILPDLKYFPVPKVDDQQAKEVEALIKDAHQCQKDSESLYAEAEALLLHELGLDNLDLSTQKSYVANFSETVESDRFDAEYFQPKYYELMKLLEFGANNKGWRLKNLGYLSERPKYGTSSKLEYLEQDKDVAFLRIADLDRLKFDPSNIKYISQKAAHVEKQSSVQTNDVLISRSGTLGLSIVVPKELDGAIFGSYFIRTRPNQKELNPIYLSLYLNSLAGKLQFERSNTGAIQTNLTIPVIESIRVIVPPIDIQEKFAQVVLDSFNVENESKFLLEQAKHQVEQIILGG